MAGKIYFLCFSMTLSCPRITLADRQRASTLQTAFLMRFPSTSRGVSTTSVLRPRPRKSPRPGQTSKLTLGVSAAKHTGVSSTARDTCRLPQDCLSQHTAVASPSSPQGNKRKGQRPKQRHGPEAPDHRLSPGSPAIKVGEAALGWWTL